VPLRVVAGSVGGRRLVAPRSGTRPTADRVKEALFAALDADGVAGASVLDLYAGSGALGIEALSRGAASAVFVDRDRHADAAIRANLATTGFEASATVSRTPVKKFLERTSRGAAFDLVFLDPPYDVDAGELSITLRALAEPGVVAPGATVVIETSRRSPPQLPEGWSVRWERAYGDTLITVATA
jgi:16S rRNA (guanine966-N2)-methyltransferase